MPTEPAAADAYDVPVAPAASAEDEAAARAQRLQEADEIFAAAKRLAADCDYAAAADLLSTVLETRCDIYGQLALECREAYILYGKCLLLSVKSTHGLDAVLAQSNRIAAAKQRAADGSAAAAAAPVAEVGDDDESGITDTLENAWECLEVARVVCLSPFPFVHVCPHLFFLHSFVCALPNRSRRSTRPTRSSSRTSSWTSAMSASRAVCRCTPRSLCPFPPIPAHASVCVCTGNAKLALEDYTKSLQIRKNLLPNSDRRIAEVFVSFAPHMHRLSLFTRCSMRHADTM